MEVTYPVPADKVSEYVQGIMVIDHNHLTEPFNLPLFANGTPTLLFQTSKGQIKGGNSNYLTLFGQTILPGKLLIKDNFTLIAYFLKPYSLPALFDIPAQELTDNPVDLNLILNSADLQEQLLNAGTPGQMITLFDTFLFSLISKSMTDEHLIKYAVKKIMDNPGKDILSEVQKEIYVTERTFQRMFERLIGTSPGRFRKINQFNNAFGQLNNRSQFKYLSDLAFENGYADQSHFIRAFKEFTNLTPKGYLNLISRI